MSEHQQGGGKGFSWQAKVQKRRLAVFNAKPGISDVLPAVGFELLCFEMRGTLVGYKAGKATPKPERGAQRQHSGLSSSLQSALRLPCLVTMKTKGEKAAK